MDGCSSPADLEDSGGSSVDDDAVLHLLRQARELLTERGSADSTARTALRHIDCCITTISTSGRSSESDEGSSGVAVAEFGLPVAERAAYCSQQTQTFSNLHSTGTQANPVMASASTATGPQPSLLGARAMQENRS